MLAPMEEPTPAPAGLMFTEIKDAVGDIIASYERRHAGVTIKPHEEAGRKIIVNKSPRGISLEVESDGRLSVSHSKDPDESEIETVFQTIDGEIWVDLGREGANRTLRQFVARELAKVLGE